MSSLPRGLAAPVLRPRLSPTVDRFLARRFLEPFLICLAAFVGIYLISEVFERFDDLVHFGALGSLGAEYFLLKLPLITSQLLPVASMAGVLLCFALLNRSGEVLAFQGLGISRLELAAPILALGVMISLFDFGFSETVVPWATRQARYIYTVQIKRRELKGVFANRGIWMRARDGFLSIDSYDPKQMILHGLTVYHMSPDYSLHDIHRAQSARWDGKQWVLTGLEVFQLKPDGTIAPIADDDFRFEAKPADFSLVRQDPEEFSLAELNRYIHSLRRKGLDPGGYLVDRDLKYALPLSCLILVAIGTVLSLDPLPRNLSLGRGFGLGVAIGFGYWVALGFTSSFGRSGLIPPWAGAWLPNAVFACIAASIFLFGEEH